MLLAARTRLPLIALASSLTRSVSVSAAMSTNPKARSFEGGPPASESGIDFYSWPTPNGLKVRCVPVRLRRAGTGADLAASPSPPRPPTRSELTDQRRSRR